MAFRMSLTAASRLNKAKLGSKAKAEAEAKERDDANELNKVLAEYQEEHGDGNIPTASEDKKSTPSSGNVVVPTGSKRHYAERARSGKSGPGTLEAESSFGFSQIQSGSSGPAQQAPSNRENTKVYASIIGKASNLPVDTDPASLESLFAVYPSLKVEKVEKVTPSGPAQRSRPSVSMLITFDKDANPTDFTKAMLALNDKKYLGRGYYLHLDRYLGEKSALSMEQRREESPPFGARPKAPEVSKGFAPPPDLGGGFREEGGFRPRQAEEKLVVKVEQPSDLPTLKLIHRTVEGVIQGGLEFEAALMQHPRVMEDEKFVWLFDSKHPLSRYYRWRLHQMASSTSRPDVFQGQAEWEGPEKPLPDEYENSYLQLNPDYEEAEIDEDEDRPQRGFVESSSGILSPHDRAMFMWFLASLPPYSLVAEDIAPFTTFAVDHVNKGINEVIDLLISNIIVPFNLTKAKTNYHPSQDGDEDRQKRSKASTNALRIVSDLALTTFKDRNLSHTWKCRQIIGERLIDRKVFEHLDNLPKRLQMGKLSEATFREDVNGVIEVWGRETLFDKKSLALFDNAFNERLRIEKQARDQANRKKAPKKVKVARKVTIRGGGGEDDMEVDTSDDVVMGNMNMDGAADEPPSPQDVVETIEVDSPKEMIRSYPEPPRWASSEAEVKQAPAPVEIPGETAAARARRMRPKAEDMFVSDGE
ncbi:hypothetical protein K505DRAFT_327040 [Melanomma pulvis-pyrius CBS 109.77]|uniref:SURP motif domain-containing protein n=1 Tax=Melanomma pulvis-pyrius CBS 109.77 TaxID=1314802 RepID=A0A6A6X501_9PLEO|nr:hypothetical protein K505DRAFT_327040 [Melanomma pulvis-pyrius CBS 109.77]